eukprot:6344716-Karenia_brevis.AAC.1
MTCACNEALMRRLYVEQMACAGCGEEIPPRTIRMMCLKPACQFHVCNRCKEQAEEGGHGEMEGDMTMIEGGEGSKRAGKTPSSEPKAKKGRDRGPPPIVALTPQPRMDDNDDDDDHPSNDTSQPLTTASMEKLLDKQTETM